MTFEFNILNLYGSLGREWLKNLPALVKSLAQTYHLSGLRPVSNLSYHYVLSGFQEGHPIILKLGLDQEALRQEAAALRAFSGYGALRVMAEEDLPFPAAPSLDPPSPTKVRKTGRWMLLERAVPGASLKSFFPHQEEKAIEILCSVLKELHKAPVPPTASFPHIQDWLRVLDKEWADIPLPTLQKARSLRDVLLQTAGPDVLLHGDLHHDNILRHGQEWKVIDPKGVRGEPLYEAGAFVRNPLPDLLDRSQAGPLIHQRIRRFSAHLQAPEKRLLDWCFVQAVLGWIWTREDQGDETFWRKITPLFHRMED